MARVAFVEGRLRAEKTGIMYVSAVLRLAGHDIRMVQTQIDDVHDFMRSFRPDFVCYSICTGEHRQALATNRDLKREYRFVSVFGGPHATFFPEIKEEEGVDYVVKGPGEGVILDIVEGRAAPGVFQGEIAEDIDELPFPDREVMYRYPEFRNNPMKNVITLRDCPYACAYCYNHAWRKLFKEHKKRFGQRRSVDNVLREIEGIREKYPLERVAFLDDHFIVGEEWLGEFFEKYPKRIGLPFSISSRISPIKDEHLVRLRKIGLETLSFALESASPVVREKILNRRGESNDRMRELSKLCTELGIRTRVYNVLGFPLEDPLKDALDTLAFNLELSVTESWAAIYQPYPKTRLADYAVGNRYLEGDLLDSVSDSFFEESRLNIKDRDRINRLQKWWTFIVLYRLPMELVSILIDIPFSQDIAQRLQQLRFEASRERFFGIH